MAPPNENFGQGIANLARRVQCCPWVLEHEPDMTSDVLDLIRCTLFYGLSGDTDAPAIQLVQAQHRPCKRGLSASAPPHYTQRSALGYFQAYVLQSGSPVAWIGLAGALDFEDEGTALGNLQHFSLLS